MQRGKEVDIPMEVMGLVIGKGGSNLKRIEKETQTKIKVRNNKIYVSGGPQETKIAEKQLKTTAFEGMYYNMLKKQSATCDTYNFVDGSGGICEFRLVPVECPRQDWHENKEFFKIERVDEEDEMVSDGEIGDLNSIITKVLQKIQAIDGRPLANMPKADFWCHFGHLYVTGNVDEDDQGKVYALKDFQSQFNIENGWKMVFDSAIKNMKIQVLEEALADFKYEKIPPHVRYDLSFITPSCSRIRAKFFLDLDGKPNLTFMDQFLDVKGDALSSTSKYVFCHHFVTRAKVSIAIPAYDMDVRITIRTVSLTLDMKETEYEESLKKYLNRVTFSTEGEILLPDEKDMPEGFFLQYIRKCDRRSYSYTGREEDSFTIVVSEEEEMDGPHAGEKKTDIHLYSDQCNQLLRSGDWEPEQITRKLPTFLLALRDIQDNIRN